MTARLREQRLVRLQGRLLPEPGFRQGELRVPERPLAAVAAAL
jgi:hypothetical protein